LHVFHPLKNGKMVTLEQKRSNSQKPKTDFYAIQSIYPHSFLKTRYGRPYHNAQW
jgi:hypothetical protein